MCGKRERERDEQEEKKMAFKNYICAQSLKRKKLSWNN